MDDKNLTNSDDLSWDETITSEELNEILKEAGEKAIQESKDKGIPFTYMDDDNKNIREYPDGRIEIISTELKY